MATTYGQEVKGGKTMENRGGTLARAWSGIGWGLFLILTGILIFSDNRGWVQGGEGWLYFVIGIGALFIIGFIVRFFGSRASRWDVSGDLALGVGMVYIGAAFLYGFSDWWPVVFIPFGIAAIAKGIWRSRAQSIAH
jgi:hypothetical protein